MLQKSPDLVGRLREIHHFLKTSDASDINDTNDTFDTNSACASAHESGRYVGVLQLCTYTDKSVRLVLQTSINSRVYLDSYPIRIEVTLCFAQNERGKI